MEPIWDFNDSTFKETIEYRPYNINHVGVRVGQGRQRDWIAGSIVEITRGPESYNLLLPGTPGATNPVEIAIMNRWGQEAYTCIPGERARSGAQSGGQAV